MSECVNSSQIDKEKKETKTKRTKQGFNKKVQKIQLCIQKKK